jgi:hypothetical protein
MRKRKRVYSKNWRNNQQQYHLGGSIMEEKTDFSNTTAVALETSKMVGLTRVLNINTKSIQVRLIDNYYLISDSVEPSRFHHPVLVKLGDRYTCVENFELVKASNEAKIEAIVFEIQDSSEIGIGLFKTVLRMAGIAGKMNYAEQARNVHALYEMYSDQQGIFERRTGGDRRSKTFQEREGMSIQEFLAGQLDKSVPTIELYLQHSAYWTIGVQDELARRGATKRHLAYLSRRRTEFLRSSDQKWSQEQIEQEVSTRALEDWLPQYVPKQEKRAVQKGQIAPPESDSANEPISPSSGESQKTEKQENQDPKPVTKGQNLEKTDPEPTRTIPQTGFAALLMKKHQNPEVDEDEPQGTPSDDLADEEVPDYTEMFPNINQKTSIADKQSRVVKLGNDLIRIGQEEPDPETFSAEIERIIAELMALFAADSKAFVTPNTQAVEGN